MYDLTPAELRFLRRLSTPAKIQDFLETLPFNFEPHGSTYYSPRLVLRHRTAHCVEGAMLAALALRLQGYRPLLVDLTAAAHDFDHVIAVYRRNGYWGAISKTNHAVLRYRDPVYKSIRELAMSYFHEYTDEWGSKTLRSYTRPVDLSRFDRQGWMTSEKNVWDVVSHLFDVPHFRVVDRGQMATLRRIDPIEREAGKIVGWKKPKKRSR